MRSVILLAMFALAPLSAMAAEAPFAGDWRIVEIHGAPAFDAAKTSFKGDADGRISSTVGCNRIVGGPKVDGAKATFAQMAATMMACPPPLDGVERAYLAALEAVRTWRKEEGGLALLGADGGTLVRLQPEE